MARHFIEVSYKGTHYSGFQVQENAVTIQSELEKAFQILHRQPVQFTGSSRTDAGVHALQNFFHFDFDTPVHTQAVYKLNSILPRDIVVRTIREMPDNAHCRFDAVSREYIYRVHRFKNPFLNETSLYYPYKLNLDLLQRGAAFLMEQENFFAFSKTNTQVNNFKCNISKSEWEQEGENLLFTIKGNRFLRGMVRLLTSALLKLGRKQISFDDLESLFAGDNRKSGSSVPSHGLFLKSVDFPQNYFSYRH